MMSTPALIVVDSLLKDFAHHHFNYDMAIVRAARQRGLCARLLIDRAAAPEVVEVLQAEPVLKALRYTPLRPTLLNSLRIGQAFQFLYAVVARFFDLRRHLSPGARRNAVVFVPTCDARNLAAWILWCACQSRDSSPTILLMLRFPCVRYDRDAVSEAIRAGYAIALKCLSWLDAAGRIKLCTDSKLLAQQYAQLTVRNIAVLPIPHTGRTADACAQGRGRDPAASVVVALGDAREEKGFDILAAAIIKLSSSASGTPLFFEVHCPVHESHQAMRCHVDRLRALPQGNVRLIQRFLGEDEYYALLNAADIVVMPYRRENYASRTSGPLIEAMAAGKIVVGTEQTWLSEQITAYGGGVTFQDGDAESLAAAIVVAHDNRSALLARARSGAQAVRAQHNPEHFLDCLADLAQAQMASPRSS